MMPLHPQVSMFLEQQAALGLKPIDQRTPADDAVRKDALSKN